MEGDPRIDKLMLPVLATIDRHVKDSDAKTEIYNRAYEALLESMDALDTSAKVTAKQIAENAKNLQRAEAAEAKVAELETDAKRFIGIIDELGRKVAELETAIRWTPVSDPPKINFEYYLAALINGRVEKVVYDRSCRHHTMWMIAGSHKPVDKMITHWMPLPNPPQEVLK